jgi:hypothetical protein
MSPELVRIVKVFGPQMSDGNEFVGQCVEDVLSGIRLMGASIGNDAWYAMRLRLIDVLRRLKTQDGKYWIGCDQVYVTRSDIESAPLGWLSRDEAYAFLEKRGLLPENLTEDQRLEVIDKHFIFPDNVIGPLERSSSD